MQPTSSRTESMGTITAQNIETHPHHSSAEHLALTVVQVVQFMGGGFCTSYCHSDTYGRTYLLREPNQRQQPGDSVRWGTCIAATLNGRKVCQTAELYPQPSCASDEISTNQNQPVSNFDFVLTMSTKTGPNLHNCTIEFSMELSIREHCLQYVLCEHVYPWRDR
jgi:hypothetical protein